MNRRFVRLAAVAGVAGVVLALAAWGDDGRQVDPREQACSEVTAAAVQGDVVAAERLAAECAAR